MAELSYLPYPSRRTSLRAVIFVFGACTAVAGLFQPAAAHHGAVRRGRTPGEFAEFMRAELVKWGKIRQGILRMR